MNNIVAWLLATGLLVAWSGQVTADEDDTEHREHGAHVHGVANLDLAVESDQVMAELTAPAMNIVGFEHSPRNDEQNRAVGQAAAWLKDGAQWLILPAAAACRLETARVESSLLDTGDADGHDHDSHDHDSHDHDSHDHDSHDHDSHDHDSHDHDSHDDEAHSEFHVHLAFHCVNPGEIRSVEIRLFERFPGMERIQLQAITETRQIGGELTAGDAVINLAE